MTAHVSTDSSSSLSSRARCPSVDDLSNDSVSFENGSPVHLNTVGVHAPRESKIVLRPLGDTLPVDILGFSSVSDPKVIRGICVSQVPGWSSVPADTLIVSQLCEGLSNQIFKVSLPSVVGSQPSSGSPVHRSSAYSCVLFRVHGKDSNTLYDTDMELEIFKTLSKYGIGPRLIARDVQKNWRIEEWHFSVTVPCRSLQNPSIFCQVASALARFHKLHQRRDFPMIFPKKPATIVRLYSWGENALKVSFSDDYQAERLRDLRVPEMVKESNWFCLEIEKRVNQINATGDGLDVVFSHNDVQENNLLQTPYGLRLIDFEYAHYNYQAYDIGNFFCEFTMDYTEKAYPFFSTDISSAPAISKKQIFASVYLSEYLETPVLPSDCELIDPLLKNVEFFEMASHLKWGLWSVIRAPQAPTFEQFDFLLYARFRFDQYLRSKRKLLETTSKHS